MYHEPSDHGCCQQLQEMSLPEEQLQNLQVLEKENTDLHIELKMLRSELASVRHREGGEEGSGGGAGDGGDLEKENASLKAENELLNEELVSLRETYTKLVVAGDNLQDMYDTLVTEKEELQKELTDSEILKQQLAKEIEKLINDSNTMSDDIENLEAVNKQLESTVHELEKKLSEGGAKASDMARVTGERDRLQETLVETEAALATLKENYELVCEEVESLQTGMQRAEYERDQIQQEFDSLQVGGNGGH